jgi:hypothetical protein
MIEKLKEIGQKIKASTVDTKTNVSNFALALMLGMFTLRSSCSDDKIKENMKALSERQVNLTDKLVKLQEQQNKTSVDLAAFNELLRKQDKSLGKQDAIVSKDSGLLALKIEENKQHQLDLAQQRRKDINDLEQSEFEIGFAGDELGSAMTYCDDSLRPRPRDYIFDPSQNPLDEHEYLYTCVDSAYSCEISHRAIASIEKTLRNPLISASDSVYYWLHQSRMGLNFYLRVIKGTSDYEIVKRSRNYYFAKTDPNKLSRAEYVNNLMIGLRDTRRSMETSVQEMQKIVYKIKYNIK